MATDPFLVLLHSTISVLTKSFKLPFRLEIKFVMKTAWSFPFINVLMRLNIPIYSLKGTFDQLLPQLINKATHPQIFKIPSICIRAMGPGLSLFSRMANMMSLILTYTVFINQKLCFCFMQVAWLSYLISNHPFESNFNPLCDLRISKPI